jgi:hypothetical protein
MLLLWRAWTDNLRFDENSNRKVVWDIGVLGRGKRVF